MADSITSQLTGLGKSISDVFINLSSEYPLLLDGIIYIFAGAGVLIGASAIFDFIKIGGRNSQGNQASTVLWKMIAASSLVDLAFWTKVWTDSIWSLSDPMDISAYVAGGGEDNSKVAVMAVIGFLVLVGYITLGRAYLQIARLGYLSPEARSDIIGSIISRIFAGSLMVAALHVSEAFNNSTGFNWLPA